MQRVGITPKWYKWLKVYEKCFKRKKFSFSRDKKQQSHQKNKYEEAILAKMSERNIDETYPENLLFFLWMKLFFR